MPEIYLVVILFGLVMESKPVPSVELCMEASTAFNQNLRILHEKNGGQPVIVGNKHIAVGDMVFACSLYPVKPFTGQQPATPL